MDNVINVKEFYAGLDAMFQKKDVAATLRYMESWLEKANLARDRAGIVAVSNEMGGLCRVIGQTDRAKELYENVLFYLEELGMANSEHYATALLNYGDVYINANENQKALEKFLQAREMLVNLGMAGDYRMAALCNNISMVYRETGEFDKAESALNIAFNIIKGIPQCRGELATTYINLGELQTRQGKLVMAEESFLKANEIFEADGGGDVHYSASCAGLAQVYKLCGRREESIRMYEKSLALIERDFGRTDAYATIEAALAEIK